MGRNARSIEVAGYSRGVKGGSEGIRTIMVPQPPHTTHRHSNTSMSSVLFIFFISNDPD
jgi:hypothetical protein